jgi:hypothetical protein
MSFLQRLSYFAFGAGLGCVIVYGLLIRDRDFPAWLPGDRVIEELTKQPVVIAPEVGVTFSDSIYKLKMEDADVEFKKSIVRASEIHPCREYHLETDLEIMRVRICDSIPKLIAYESLN